MSSDKNEKSPISADVVRELAEILRETELTEIEVERGDLRLRVARELTAAPMAMQMPAMAPAPVAAAPAPAAAPPETPAPTDASDMSAHPGVLKSPMVGTVYRQSSPDDDPFANVGDMVKEGDTVLLIEAMKTFNPIIAHKPGKIADILVEDGQPVEFGEPLFIIV